VKRSFVGIADAIADIPDFIRRRALAMNPVGADLAAGAGAAAKLCGGAVKPTW